MTKVLNFIKSVASITQEVVNIGYNPDGQFSTKLAVTIGCKSLT